jgi:hypothetical protein
MHTTIELMMVESTLLDQELKYHYLVADERVRNPRTGFIANLLDQFRSLLMGRPVVTQERGI